MNVEARLQGGFYGMGNSSSRFEKYPFLHANPTMETAPIAPAMLVAVVMAWLFAWSQVGLTSKFPREVALRCLVEAGADRGEG